MAVMSIPPSENPRIVKYLTREKSIPTSHKCAERSVATSDS
jgi:hypothetical protein